MDADANVTNLERDKASEVPEPAVHEQAIPADLIDRDAAKVLRRLKRNGHTAYLVGGGVRDLLLGRKPKDFDVATSAHPQEVRSLFGNCRIIGRRFRLAHILFSGGKIIETATFRRDPGANTGEPIRRDNVFGEPHEDALRRDFTINGLFYDIEQEAVIDYVGGVPDLEAQVVRMIGDPDIRLREDPVRILRALKFSARLDLGIDPDLYDSMRLHRTTLREASAPRVLEEIFRLMRGGAAQRSIYLAWDTGILAEILPELSSLLDEHAPGTSALWRRLQEIDRRHAEGEQVSDAVLFTSLLHGSIREWTQDSRRPATAIDSFFEDMTERLTVPRRLRDRVRVILGAQSRLLAGKADKLTARDFYTDAASFCAIEAAGRGDEAPELPRPKRRRRSRRGR